MAPALVLAVLAAVGAFRAYRVADRKVKRRDAALTSVRAELKLTQEACDRQTAKARHLLKQAKGYRDEVLRLSERNADLRDQVDIATGAVREPSLTEEITAWLGTRPTTNPEDQR